MYMKRFKSNFSLGARFAFGVALLYWVFLLLTSENINGVLENTKLIAYTATFALVILYGWLKQTYLTIQDGRVKYVSFFFERKVANLSETKLVTISTVAGFIKFLCLVHYPQGNEKLMQISLAMFKPQTLNEFVTEILKQNPSVTIHETVERAIGEIREY